MTENSTQILTQENLNAEINNIISTIEKDFDTLNINFIKNKSAKFNILDENKKIKIWCANNCEGKFFIGNVTAMFEKKSDALKFKLVWCN